MGDLENLYTWYMYYQIRDVLLKKLLLIYEASEWVPAAIL